MPLCHGMGGVWARTIVNVSTAAIVIGLLKRKGTEGGISNVPITHCQSAKCHRCRTSVQVTRTLPHLLLPLTITLTKGHQSTVTDRQMIVAPAAPAHPHPSTWRMIGGPAGLGSVP
jgi:hypothetical protein